MSGVYMLMAVPICLQVVGDIWLSGRFSFAQCQRGQKKAGENGDDGDDDEKFDERECGFAARVFPAGICWVCIVGLWLVCRIFVYVTMEMRVCGQMYRS